MKIYINEAQEREISRAVDTVDVSTPRQRNAVIFREGSAPAVVIISNYPNARGYCLGAGDIVDGLGVVIYAPGAFDLEEEIKTAYPGECDFNDVLFMYTEKFHDLKTRYLAEFRRREHIQKIIRRALGDCAFTLETGSAGEDNAR